MTFISADRVRETSTTTGTGTYSLGGAVSGFRSFVAGIGTGNTCHYLATDAAGNWELGTGLVTDAATDTLDRTRIWSSSNANAAVSWAAGSKTLSCVPIAAAIRDVVTPKGHIFDLSMSNAADTVNDITVSSGEAVDENGEVLMVLPASITKRLDAAWTVGDGGGGLNTGTKATNTWYEVLLISRQDTGVVDVMFSTTGNRATLPANYTHKRRIGWIRNGASSILQFSQTGDYITLFTPINDVAVAKTTTLTTVTVTVPPNCIGRFRGGVDSTTSANANASTVIREMSADTSAPSATTGLATFGYADLATWYDAQQFELRVDGSSQMKHDSSVAVGNLDISTYGWIDRRRRIEPV